MKFDSDFRTVVICLVILFEPPADFAGLDPDYRVVSGGIPNRALKQIDPDGALLEPIMVPIEAVVDDIGKKLLAALARLEHGAVQDRVEFPEDQLFLTLVENMDLSVDLVWPDMASRQIHDIHCLPYKSATSAQRDAQDLASIQ